MRLVLIVPPTGKVARNQRVYLEEGETVDIGGASDCGAVLDDPSVGTARLRLEHYGNAWTVQDLEGLGKCVVGGVRLRARARRILRAPLSLWLGDVECRMELDVAERDDPSTRELALRILGGAAALAGEAPVVRIAEGKGMGEAITLAPDEPRIVGRGRDAALFLDDPDASRHHLSVAWRGGRVMVTDLGSAGGTYLGKARLLASRAAVWPPARMLVAGQTVLLLEATRRELLADIRPGAMDAEEATGSGDDPEGPAIHRAASAAQPVALDGKDGKDGEDSEEGAHDAAPPPPGSSRAGGPAVAAPMVALPPDRRRVHRDDRRIRWATLAFVVLAAATLVATGWFLASAR